jgi:hypothetical protein
MLITDGRPATMRALRRVFQVAVLGALLAISTSSAARAAERCPAGAGGGATLVALDPELRLQFIDERLARTADRAQVWTWGWGIGIGVATVNLFHFQETRRRRRR